MAETSRLAVSYGSFACVVEGFDDPFAVMQQVVGFFQDTARTDPSFADFGNIADFDALRGRMAVSHPESTIDLEPIAGGVMMRRLPAKAGSAALAAVDEAPAPEPAQTEPADPQDDADLSDDMAAKLASYAAALDSEAAKPQQVPGDAVENQPTDADNRGDDQGDNQSDDAEEDMFGDDDMAAAADAEAAPPAASTGTGSSSGDLSSWVRNLRGFGARTSRPEEQTPPQTTDIEESAPADTASAGGYLDEADLEDDYRADDDRTGADHADADHADDDLESLAEIAEQVDADDLGDLERLEAEADAALSLADDLDASAPEAPEPEATETEVSLRDELADESLAEPEAQPDPEPARRPSIFDRLGPDPTPAPRPDSIFNQAPASADEPPTTQDVPPQDAPPAEPVFAAASDDSDQWHDDDADQDREGDPDGDREDDDDNNILATYQEAAGNTDLDEGEDPETPDSNQAVDEDDDDFDLEAAVSAAFGEEFEADDQKSPTRSETDSDDRDEGDESPAAPLRLNATNPPAQTPFRLGGTPTEPSKPDTAPNAPLRLSGAPPLRLADSGAVKPSQPMRLGEDAPAGDFVDRVIGDHEDEDVPASPPPAEAPLNLRELMSEATKDEQAADDTEEPAPTARRGLGLRFPGLGGRKPAADEKGDAAKAESAPPAAAKPAFGEADRANRFHLISNASAPETTAPSAELESAPEPAPAAKSGGRGLLGSLLGGRSAAAAPPAKPAPAAPEPAAPPRQAKDTAPKPAKGDVDAETQSMRSRLNSSYSAEPVPVSTMAFDLGPDDGDPHSARTTARKLGANSVQDLMTAAAAHLMLIEGQDSVSRGDVLALAQELAGATPLTAEAKVKAFGKLTRNGDLIRVDGGRFLLSGEAVEEIQDRLNVNYG